MRGIWLLAPNFIFIILCKEILLKVLCCHYVFYFCNRRCILKALCGIIAELILMQMNEDRFSIILQKLKIVAKKRSSFILDTTDSCFQLSYELHTISSLAYAYTNCTSCVVPYNIEYLCIFIYYFYALVYNTISIIIKN